MLYLLLDLSNISFIISTTKASCVSTTHINNAINNNKALK